MSSLNTLNNQFQQTNTIGGTLKTTLMSMSWTSLAGIGFLILCLILIGYFVYINYKNASSTTYNANKEHNKKGADVSKVAQMMLFYVDWCPHCKTAKPEWDDLKAEYEGKTINGYNIMFVEYNCTEDTTENVELMDKYKIEGYPTIKLIKDNEVIEYDAKPTKATMSQFLNSVL